MDLERQFTPCILRTAAYINFTGLFEELDRT